MFSLLIKFLKEFKINYDKELFKIIKDKLN
jgi:hypothetical protein